jgi:hypothetical protein
MSNQVHDMIRGLANFNKDQKSRCVVNNRIFYREGDGLSDKVHFGYKTIFAYYFEHHIGKNIDYIEFNKQVFINLIIASFSYSKLPHMFDSILGVTGTLEAMSDSQIEILENDYKVTKQYVLPSIYPASNRQIQFRKVYNI